MTRAQGWIVIGLLWCIVMMLFVLNVTASRLPACEPPSREYGSIVQNDGSCR